MPSFQIITFGCKVNQCDSAWLAQELSHQGWQAAAADAAPDLLLINTCTVTARADQQARQAIRRMARRYPEAVLTVTGCYAQRTPAELVKLPAIKLVCGNREKHLLPRLVDGLARGVPNIIRVSEFLTQEPLVCWRLREFAGHSRAWLKIQEGCRQRCSYCIVPMVRGPSRSLAPHLVKKSLQDLALAGYPEVVLTGINLGQYGHDLSLPPTSSRLMVDGSQPTTHPEDLSALIQDLAHQPWPCRLRLSSLEPHQITPRLLDALESWPQFCPHFHLPLQSGAAPVLAAMHRPYSPRDFQAVVWEIRRRFPDAAIGLDVLVGFPTETTADFEATRALVDSLPVSYLHVFPYSPRPGTPAAELPPLPSLEVQSRARILRALGRQKKEQFYHSQLGRIEEVAVEGAAESDGCLRGLSANYLRVLLPEAPRNHHRRLRVRFVSRRGAFMIAEPV